MSEEKRRPGRPATERGTAPKRNIRMHDELWKPAEERARALGITTSDYLRRVIRIGMEHDYAFLERRWDDAGTA